MSALAWPSAFCRRDGAGDAPLRRRQRFFLRSAPSLHRRPHHLRVLGESKEIETEAAVLNESSELDKLVDGMDFGELCNDFECLSSPYVEATARQLARDILELREENRSLGSYAISVKYKDLLRTFTGREKYDRPLWATEALENPSVTVQEMQMLSTSELNIKWLLKGKPKNPLFAIMGGDLILLVNSRFILNQISGQVIEHEELWDLSASTVVAQSYFWISRMLFSTIEAGKDTVDSVKSMTTGSSSEKNMGMYSDMSGDPTKFFQRDDGFQRDAYQFVLFLAIIYFVVQFLRHVIYCKSMVSVELFCESQSSTFSGNLLTKRSARS